MADLANVLNGEEITLDGTDQIILLKASDALKALAQKNAPANVKVTVHGAGGAQVGVEAIVAGHHLWPTNAVAEVSLSGNQKLHIKGTNTQKATINY